MKEKGRKEEVLSSDMLKQIRLAQRNEVTEYHIYKRMSRLAKDNSNKDILNKIAGEELEHYRFWMNYGDEVDPIWWKVNLYILLARFFGLVFSLKLMERGELSAQRKYAEMAKVIPEIRKIAEEERGHEKTLLNMVSDLRLKGTGTWIISVNLVLLSVAGLGVALSIISTDLKMVGISVFLGAVAVSLSDFLATILLKNFSGLKQDTLLRAFVRLFSGLLAGVLTVVPFFYAVNGFVAVLSAFAISLLLCLALNYYHAVISDHPVKKKVVRIFLVYIIVILAAAGAGYLVNISLTG